MDRETLGERLRRMEWDDFEVKAAAGGIPDDAYKTVSAFANTWGGWLVFGVHDDGGRCTVIGVTDPDKMQNDFLGTCRSVNKFSRVPEILPRQYELEGKPVLAFYVHPASRFDKPLRVKVKKAWETYIRVGSGDHHCSPQEEARFLRDASEETFDAGVISGLTVGDLEPKAIRWLRGVISQRSTTRLRPDLSDAEFLEKAGLLRGVGEVTRGAALLVGKAPVVSRLKPAGVVDFRLHHAPWSEETPADRWHDRELCEGNLVETIQVLFERLFRLCEQPFAMDPNGMQRRAESPDYVAVREALVNLLIHQDYSDQHRTGRILWFTDRVLFDNPGDSFVNVADMVGGGSSQLRNPMLARIFRWADFADQGGTGIPNIVRTWREAERRPPEILNDPGRKCYALTLHWQKLDTERDASLYASLGYTVSPDGARVLRLARELRRVSRTVAQLATGLSAVRTMELLANLVAQQLLVPAGQEGDFFLLADHLREQFTEPAARDHGPSVGPPSTRAVRVAIDRLPRSGPHFVNRGAELRRLDAAWADPHQHVLSIVAWGGAGKSALVNHWLAAMDRDGYRGAERVFAWSFYSQATEERLASADLFIDQALRWFGDPDPAAGSPRDRGLRLADRVREQPTLLVLDGIEPLQHPPGPLAGRIKDPALAALVKSLAAASSGLCVFTTREPIDDLAHLTGSSTPRLDLEQLTPESGAELLRQLGVKGTAGEVRAAVEELGGHALALTLLGTYLRKGYGGEVRKRGEVALGEADQRQGGHAGRVMAAYERWLGPGPEVEILRLLGLFDRPAEGEAIAALRSAPVIPELNDTLVELAESDWQWALSNLRECGLVAAPDVDAPAALDAHPLVRTYFGDQLRERRPGAWRAGHERLYEHYRQAAPERPETLEEMMPLYAAVLHGCRAGKHKDAYDEVYRPRIRRGDELYQLRQLGAFGADLVALAGFFARPWEEPVASLTADDKAWLLNAAGFELRALGRLTEALAPIRAGLESRIAQQDWKNAAGGSGNLSELFLTLGDLRPAVAAAEESLRLADRSGDAFERVVGRAILADALHQAGRFEHSAAAFREAEAMQAERQPQYPRLLSLSGFRYCDLLLGPGRRHGPEVWSGLEGSVPAPGDVEQLQQACREVLVRASEALKIAERNNWLLEVALDLVTLGRAHFGLGLAAAPGGDRATEDFAAAAEHLERAVAGVRQSGREDVLPSGLLARAALRRVVGDRSGASADLAEAQEIAERGSMLLHQCDVYLERTRLLLAAGEDAAARRQLAMAKALVEKTGYHRRDAEVAFLDKRLGC